MEHDRAQLSSHIRENWRGRPLTDHETIVQLIGSVRTTTGLTVNAKLDTRVSIGPSASVW